MISVCVVQCAIVHRIRHISLTNVSNNLQPTLYIFYLFSLFRTLKKYIQCIHYSIAMPNNIAEQDKKITKCNAILFMNWYFII